MTSNARAPWLHGGSTSLLGATSGTSGTGASSAAWQAEGLGATGAGLRPHSLLLPGGAAALGAAAGGEV